MNQNRITFVLIISFILVVVGALAYRATRTPSVQAPTTQSTSTKNLLPSDASQSENYSLIPLKQELQVAPATSTTSSSSATTTP